MATNLSGLDKHNKKTAHFIYDVPKDGGAAGAHTITGDKIPANALIVATQLFVETAFVGGTSVSFGIVAAADVSSAIATATLVIDYAVAGTQVPQTGTSWLKSGATERDLICTVIGTYTAGRVHVWADYVVIV
jgi:hypothetical protein